MEDRPVYLDPSAPVELRVKDLLGRMTLEEKVAQLQSVWLRMVVREALSEEKLREFLSMGIGELTRVSGSWGGQAWGRGENSKRGAKIPN